MRGDTFFFHLVRRRSGAEWPEPIIGAIVPSSIPDYSDTVWYIWAQKGGCWIAKGQAESLRRAITWIEMEAGATRAITEGREDPYATCSDCGATCGATDDTRCRTCGDGIYTRHPLAPRRRQEAVYQ